MRSYFQTKPNFSEKGVNVGRNEFNIKCPFCDDSSSHLGINLDKQVFSCLKCKTSGSLYKLVFKLEKNPDKTKQIFKEYPNKRSFFDKQRASDIPILSEFSKTPTQKAYNYLKNRNFNPDYIIEKYSLLFPDFTSAYRNRIVIPFFENNQTVTFTSRDIGYSEVRYKSLSSEKSIKTPKETLYNIDSVNSNKVLIVEGVFDVWRIGDNCLSVSGSSITDDHIKQLIQKRIRYVFLCYDNEYEAQTRAENDAMKLSAFFDVKIIKQDYAKDVGDISDEKLNYLKYLLKTRLKG